MNLREKLQAYQSRLINASTLQPDEAGRIIVELTSYMSNLNAKLLETQLAYNQKHLEIMEEVRSVAKSSLVAQTTQEWRDYQEVKGWIDVVREMIRGLKFYIRSNEDEYSLSKHT
jgi:hypothetical protein